MKNAKVTKTMRKNLNNISCSNCKTQVAHKKDNRLLRDKWYIEILKVIYCKKCYVSK